MRLVFATLLAFTIGFSPLATAHARPAPASRPSAMSCHEMTNTDQGSGRKDQMPSDDLRACADHCLSQVNGQPALVRIRAPSLLNVIRAEPTPMAHLGKPHFRDPPDPPPPRL